MDEQRLVHPDIVRTPDLHRHWKRNASIPATWIVAECEVAIVRGKRDREPFARQPRTSAVIPAEGYGRTFSWCKIVY
jgi:hypothetical protein